MKKRLLLSASVIAIVLSNSLAWAQHTNGGGSGSSGMAASGSNATSAALQAIATNAGSATLAIGGALSIGAGAGITSSGAGGALGTGAFAAAYSLPAATSSTLGGVKPDGTTITNSTGAISVTYGTAANTAAQGNDARLGAGTVSGAVKSNGSNSFSQAACADLSNGGTGCSAK